MKVLALDFGGSSVKYAVVDENGKMEYRGKKPAPLDSPEQFVDTVNEIYAPVKDQVAGIGISLPGNIDPETGKLFTNGVYTQLYGYEIPELIAKKCPVPVAVENDGKCGALSEAWMGGLADCKDGAVVILGSGIAGGLIKDHKIHSGKDFNAGEFSYLITNPDDPTMFSCAFANSAMLGITYKLCKKKNLDLDFQDSAPTMHFLDDKYHDHFPTPAGEVKQIKADGRQFEAWVNEGDPDALEVYHDLVRSLAVLIFNVQICYAPDKIVVGGGLSKQTGIFPDLAAELTRYADAIGIPENMRAVVVPSTFRDECNLLGATYNFIIRKGEN